MLLRLYLIGVVLDLATIVAGVASRSREALVRGLSQLALITVLAASLAAGPPGIAALGLLLAALSLRDLRSLASTRSAWFWAWSVPLMAVLTAGPALLEVRIAALLLLATWTTGIAGLLLLGRASARRRTIAPAQSSGELGAHPGLGQVHVMLLALVAGSGFSAAIQLGARVGMEQLLAAVFLLQVHDSWAYVGGRLSGRHKLAPAISPGKTVEGSLAGGVVMAVFAFLLTTPLLPAYTRLQAWAVLGIVVLVILLGTGGDLLFSWAKRQARIKDFPTVLPGHGGILDRFDSLVGLLPALLLWTVLT